MAPAAQWTLAIAAALGLLGVMAGAFGAHALRDAVSARDLSTWQTAAHYQQVHAVLLAAIGLLGTRGGAMGRGETGGARGPTRALRSAAVLLTIGILVFSGTLFAMVLGGPRILGAVTPLGGLCLMGGWGALIVHALSARTPR